MPSTRQVSSPGQSLAGSHERAALHPMGVLQREQLGARLANAKGERGFAVHAVLRLAVGLNGSGRDGCSRHKNPSCRGPTLPAWLLLQEPHLLSQSTLPG